MNAVTLLYHDAAEAENPDGSGFPGAGPAVYKLTPAEMAAHFDALAAAGFRPGSALSLLDAPNDRARQPAFITFDDGGVSAVRIAALLEAHGWIGHFFVTTGYIGRASFLDAEGIRELDRRGHVIGSHSQSHPPRMSALKPEQLRREWSAGVETLAGILGRPVCVASVPGGYYSRAVAEAADAAGIRVLFTSEPVKIAATVGKCLVLGRFSITRGMSPERAVALSVSGRSAAQLRQYLAWNLKKVVKTVGGEQYLQLRRYLLRV